jgi:nicotinamide-nucleotide amidase
MPNCEIITIGSELLNGSVLNTNAKYLAEQVTALDIDVAHQVACRDQEQEIMDSLHVALSRSQLIFMTGGLGPTPDDITRESIARYFGCGLTFDPKQYRQIAKFFRTMRKEPPAITRREAFRPSIAKPLLNRFGIALGFYIKLTNRLIVVLPGVPRELVKMFETRVGELVKQIFPCRQPNYSLVAKVVGLNEPQIMKRLGQTFFRGRTFEFGIYPAIGEVTIRLKSCRRSLMPKLRLDLSRALKPHIFSFQDDTVASAIGKVLVRKKMTISCAESCTGGMISKFLTDVSGSSRFFLGATIAYSNRVKEGMLGVAKTLLTQKGAVSKEVAAALSRGARERFESTLAVSITGIAGPTGGTHKKPVGLVYISISDRRHTKTYEFQFRGDRSRIRRQAAQRALYLVWKWVTA